MIVGLAVGVFHRHASMRNTRSPHWSSTLSVVGDVDGIPDRTFAAMAHVGTGQSEVGVRSGAGDELLHGVHLDPSCPADLPGRAADLGDVDRDGVSDWAMAIGCLDGRSRVDVVAGASGDVLFGLGLPPQHDPGPALLVTLEDLDGDGVRELVVTQGEELVAYSGRRRLW